MPSKQMSGRRAKRPEAWGRERGWTIHQWGCDRAEGIQNTFVLELESLYVVSETVSVFVFEGNGFYNIQVLYIQRRRAN